MSKRIERINSLVEKELGQIILKEIEFPKDVLATLTRVKTSIDLANAKVYIAVLPPSQTEKVLGILNKMIYELQKILNKRLRMRPVPKIRFVEEEQNEEAAKIEGILEGLKNEEK
ncbi:30S ribosome-binding factor RbfA [Patescibacteria group bacterium]|nr:30S ribosome-binding factor RbfA [Patescibacteria group bacterium]